MMKMVDKRSTEIVDVALVYGDVDGWWRSHLVDSAQMGPKDRQN